MAKNLLKSVIKSYNRTPGRINTRELVEKIESGYLVDNKDGFKTKKTFSPSSLVFGHGECARYWYIAFHGADFADEVTPQQVANMRNGTLGHERIQKAITDAGIMITNEKKMINADPPIFGYRDAEIDWKGSSIPVEIKTTSERAFEMRKSMGTPAPYHVAQLLIYMHIEQHEMGIILYENKNTHELLAMPVEMNDTYRDWLNEAFEWMRTVKKASDANTLPIVKYRSNSKICKSCPVREACKEMKDGTVDIEPLRSLS